MLRPCTLQRARLHPSSQPPGTQKQVASPTQTMATRANRSVRARKLSTKANLPIHHESDGIELVALLEEEARHLGKIVTGVEENEETVRTSVPCFPAPLIWPSLSPLWLKPQRLPSYNHVTFEDGFIRCVPVTAIMWCREELMKLQNANGQLGTPSASYHRWRSRRQHGQHPHP